jgi:hypothetical protein
MPRHVYTRTCRQRSHTLLTYSVHACRSWLMPGRMSATSPRHTGSSSCMFPMTRIYATGSLRWICSRQQPCSPSTCVICLSMCVMSLSHIPSAWKHAVISFCVHYEYYKHTSLIVTIDMKSVHTCVDICVCRLLTKSHHYGSHVCEMKSNQQALVLFKKGATYEIFTALAAERGVNFKMC